MRLFSGATGYASPVEGSFVQGHEKRYETADTQALAMLAAQEAVDFDRATLLPVRPLPAGWFRARRAGSPQSTKKGGTVSV